MTLECPECDGEMVLRNSRYGKFYGCTKWPACDATHGAHANGKPLGVPADKETKEWRIKAHVAFDGLWKGKGQMTRNQAYKWLQEQLGMSPDECHIGRFNREQCRCVVQLCVTA
jgi:ssDNA-binding Zn-finger/Zn-ribbon topoisomerase 1